MNTDKLTAERSLAIITNAIAEAKSQFEEDGLVYVFWGALSTIAAFTQFYLLMIDRHDINYYPYFLMPFGGFFTWWYYAKKKKEKPNKVARMVSASWIIISINILLFSFVFANILREQLIPIILIMLGIGSMISGRALESKTLFWAGVFLNITGWACFYINWLYQPLAMGIASLIGVFLPGLLLMRKYKKIRT